MTRGFAAVGLYRPKDSNNIGAVLRAAHCFRAMRVKETLKYLALGEACAQS